MKPTPTENSPRRNSRSGAILVVAMVTLLLVALLGASLMRSALTSLQQLQREQMLIQATWLADAGCQRALFRMKDDANYRAEAWAIPADQLKSGSAVVQIEIAADPESAARNIVTATAEYPKGTHQSIRVSKRLVVPNTRP